MNTDRERFESKIDKSGDCWIWTASVGKPGYGQFHVRKSPHVYKNVRASRYAYELYVGQIPDGLCVCHHCDNPRCVNPEHLFIGTQKENCADKVSKNRQQVGVAAAVRAKLTAAQVSEIRDLWRSGGLDQLQIAKKFGVCRSTISKIVTGATRHYPEALS